VAGHAAGCYLAEQDSGQFIYGLGIAPKAHLLAQNNHHSATALCRETVTQTVAGTAGTIQNNSWGAGTANPMTYGSMEATYDALVRNADADGPRPKPLTICFSSGNSGSAGLTRPKAAKNLIVTGNSETYRPDVGKDQSDSIDEVYVGPRGSSHGNCGDGRIAPHLVAPGEWTASANYDSRPGEREYISARLTWGGGSSAASPKTAGACALLTQWWRQHNHGHDPSPALLKALLVNGAEPMQAGGPIPNPIQGWGRLNLGNVLSGAVRHFYLDQSAMLTARGEQKSWTIRVSDPRKPVKITLCWTDPPGAIGSGTPQVSAIVNPLALQLECNGQRYRANQFQNGWSYPGGSAQHEGQDNLQNIYLPGGIGADRLQVSVTALSLTTNCLTGRISSPQQDFALVVANGSLDESTTPTNIFVAVDPASQNSEPAASSDNFWQGDDQDGQDLDQVWWHRITPTRSEPAPSASGAATSPDQANSDDTVDRWWLQQDVWWNAETEAETNREAKALGQGLTTAAIALTAGQHKLFTASPIAAESSGAASDLIQVSTDRNQDHNQDRPAEALQNLPLSQALSQLMHQWHHLEGKQTHRPVAVLVVRSTTRISLADLSALRRLAFWGQVYLVSDYAPILAFLAQRIHHATGLQMRLASDAHALPALMQDTLLEASGVQQAEVHQIAEPLLEGSAIHHLVQITPSDRRMTIQVQFSPAAPPELQLIAPDQVPLAIGDPSTGPVTLTSRPGLLQLDVEATQVLSWAGQWTVLLKQTDQQNLSRVRVWVQSDLQWQVRAQDAPVREETERGQQTVLITVTGSSTQLSRLQAQPRTISAGSGGAALPRQETERWITAEAELPRRNPSARAEESQREEREPVHAATLSAILPYPQHQGTMAIDFPTRIEGVDAFGYRYSRLLRRSLLRLEPRSRWRQRLDRPRPVLFTAAQIAQVHVEAGHVTGLTLKRGHQTRRVLVKAPRLRQCLTQAFQHHFPQQNLVAGVLGNELQGIFCPLQQSSSRQLAISLPNEEV
ncbi:MAG: S8 family serine peptidase, partial [Elainellaceae cyanobacterium]